MYLKYLFIHLSRREMGNHRNHLSMEIVKMKDGLASFVQHIVFSYIYYAIDRLLGASQKLVSHFHHSVMVSEALKKKQ